MTAEAQIDPLTAEPSFLRLDREVMARHFPSEPFRYRHGLAGHPLLQLDALAALVRQLPRDRIEFNSGRLQPNQKPDETPGVDLEPEEIVRRIETAGAWLVLKNVEAVPAYRRLIAAVLGEAAALSRQDVLDDLGIEISPARLKCAMLSIDTLHRGLEGRVPADAIEENAVP